MQPQPAQPLGDQVGVAREIGVNTAPHHARADQTDIELEEIAQSSEIHARDISCADVCEFGVD